MITGGARVVADPDRLAALERAPIPRWAPDWDGHVIAISTELVSGRRVGTMPDDRWR